MIHGSTKSGAFSKCRRKRHFWFQCERFLCEKIVFHLHTKAFIIVQEFIGAIHSAKMSSLQWELTLYPILAHHVGNGSQYIALFTNFLNHRVQAFRNGFRRMH